jgi:gamma-glutamyltranspeptidase/glutathione hydrolase
MRPRSAALATEAVAEQAALAHLANGGGALGAVLSGFFAAAGARPGVLLGPLSVLVGGVGQGARAFDGRLRQPGLGAKRPRGFLTSAEVPNAARVAAPSAPFAAVIAHAYGSDSLRSLIAPGIAAAEQAGADKRARFLDRIGQVGAPALTEPGFQRAMLRVASPSEGGVLTPSDLEKCDEVDQPAREREALDARWVEVPWADSSPTPLANERGAGVCAADMHGVVAALTYRVCDVGVLIEELDLIAPPAAIPVMRGVPRTAPGSRIAAAAPMAIRLDASQRPTELLLEAESQRLSPDAKSNQRLVLRRDPETLYVSGVRQ